MLRLGTEQVKKAQNYRFLKFTFLLLYNIVFTDSFKLFMTRNTVYFELRVIAFKRVKSYASIIIFKWLLKNRVATCGALVDASDFKRMRPVVTNANRREYNNILYTNTQYARFR